MKKVVIFGAGTLGRSLYAQLKGAADISDIVVVDNDRDKLNDHVLSPDILKTLQFDILYIAASFAYNEILVQLTEELNIPKNKIANIEEVQEHFQTLAEDESTIIGDFWSDEHTKKRVKLNWSESPFAIRQINKLYFNIDSGSYLAGHMQLLSNRLSGRTLKTGISIGCGSASAEMNMLRQGIVEKFICFELAEKVIELAKKRSEKLGLSDRIEFINADVFAADLEDTKIDFVHWNHSLHHMFDAKASVKWSYDLLQPGGVFYFNEYVGASRFQFARHVVDAANEVRSSMPRKYLKNPQRDGTYIERYENPDVYIMKKTDPSEAADSANILSGVRQYFPQAEIVPMGGLVYFAALSRLWGNFDEENEEDLAFLARLMEKDKFYSNKSEDMNPFMAGIAIK